MGQHRINEKDGFKTVLFLTLPNLSALASLVQWEKSTAPFLPPLSKGEIYCPFLASLIKGRNLLPLSCPPCVKGRNTPPISCLPYQREGDRLRWWDCKKEISKLTPNQLLRDPIATLQDDSIVTRKPYLCHSGTRRKPK